MSEFRVMLISGSLRQGSFNSAMIRTAGTLIEQRGLQVSTLGLRDFPPYDSDVEIAGVPAMVRAAKKAVAAVDVVVVSTPEYNGGPSGVLKNALDWLSRPYRRSVLTDKVFGIASVAPGGHGGRLALTRLRETLVHCGARVLNPDLALAFDADDHLDDAGEISHPDVVAEVDGWISALFGPVTANSGTRTCSPLLLANQTPAPRAGRR
ncbi:NADPH-dependent FMN reductase [Nonomuraea sp. NPDC026600]|uniref:NADPH-dependent FMN reductase n=1 Tax=Nonomuraea sp. NPDC026600 TaxID=3155363 RepID=UPI0034085FD5